MSIKNYILYYYERVGAQCLCCAMYSTIMSITNYTIICIYRLLTFNTLYITLPLISLSQAVFKVDI